MPSKQIAPQRRCRDDLPESHHECGHRRHHRRDLHSDAARPGQPERHAARTLASTGLPTTRVIAQQSRATGVGDRRSPGRHLRCQRVVARARRGDAERDGARGSGPSPISTRWSHYAGLLYVTELNRHDVVAVDPTSGASVAVAVNLPAPQGLAVTAERHPRDRRRHHQHALLACPRAGLPDAASQLPAIRATSTTSSTRGSAHDRRGNPYQARCSLVPLRCSSITRRSRARSAISTRIGGATTPLMIAVTTSAWMGSMLRTLISSTADQRDRR